MRALVEDAGLSQREAAARSGLRADTVGRWARRFGWRRTDGRWTDAESLAENGNFYARHAEERSKSASRITPPGSGPGGNRERGACFETQPAAAPQHDQVGSVRAGSEGSAAHRPYRYGPEVREAARGRVEGTWDGLERIGIELGVARWTLYRWQRRFGWTRPAPPERDGPGFHRSRRFGRAHGGDAVATARDLVTGSDLPLRRIAARAGVSRATLCRWMKDRGWTRNPAVPKAGRREPYGPAVMAAARELYERSGLSARIIAARVGATPERVGHWAKTRGWTRLRDAPGPDGRVRRGRATSLSSSWRS